MKLINLKKAINEIAIILAQNQKLCQLLVNDTDKPFDTAVTMNLNDLIKDHYICMYPPVENRIEEYGRNTFITLLLDNAMFNQRDDNITSNIIIYVATNEDHLILEKNQNRLLEMCDLIDTLLNGIKLTSAGEAQVTSISHVMLSEFHPAYRMNLVITDQQSRKAEI